jgi:hypothetical protein
MAEEKFDNSDRKDFEELAAKLQEASPYLENKIDDLLKQRPDLLTYQRDDVGRMFVASYKLGAMVRIMIMDWLAWAYDMPNEGFVHPAKDDPDGPTTRN